MTDNEKLPVISEEKTLKDSFEKIKHENLCLKSELVAALEERDVLRKELNRAKLNTESMQESITQLQIEKTHLEGQIKAFEFCVSKGVL